jgi:predicted nucleic acid-binding protein
MIVVANAGPLIALAQIGQLEILPALYGEIHIPPAVRREVLAYGRERPGAAEISTASWIRVNPIRDRTAVQLLLERLDAGESAAIVLARELRSILQIRCRIPSGRSRRHALITFHAASLHISHSRIFGERNTLGTRRELSQPAR